VLITHTINFDCGDFSEILIVALFEKQVLEGAERREVLGLELEELLEHRDGTVRLVETVRTQPGDLESRGDAPGPTISSGQGGDQGVLQRLEVASSATDLCEGRARKLIVWSDRRGLTKTDFG
jgi:hypothetical protein